MRADPIEEWRRLTALYGEMGEIEIRELVGQINDLTPTAQQILRDELKKRGIAEARAERNIREVTGDRPGLVNYEPSSYRYKFIEVPPVDEGPHEYTWKTPLCECDTKEQVEQLSEALSRAGIDCWIERPSSKFSTYDFRVLVAADQLDQARVIASQPIPQDIVDESKEDNSEPEYFQVPACPKCGAADPVLCPAEEPKKGEPKPKESDWVNNWLCESCGHTWSDPVADPATSRQPGPALVHDNFLDCRNPQKRKEPPGNWAAPSFRENSSNGGKTIRTFWLHSRCGGPECQE
jgi:hypothetical protein